MSCVMSHVTRDRASLMRHACIGKCIYNGSATDACLMARAQDEAGPPGGGESEEREAANALWR
eukprot:2849686-Rhodomonas_salina.1